MIRLAFMLLVASTFDAHAQLYLLVDSRTGRVWTNAVPERVQVIDFGTRNDDLRDYSAKGFPMPPDFPAVFDPRSCAVVVRPASMQDARSTIRSAREEAREPDAIAKAARQEWRRTGRDVMTALGQPATNGNSLLPPAMYDAVGTVTNANTRRDLHLRALQSDLTLTRAQLERQAPSVPWWWLPEEE